MRKSVLEPLVLSDGEREMLERWARRPKSSQALIRTWIANWNDEPKPFVWHKTADEILDSLAAYCQRINDSGH